jgi:hypothetical protein
VLRVVLALLAVSVAGSASAGWRDLRIDASSEAAFTESVAMLQEKLSRTRAGFLTLALHDLWVTGTERAESDGRVFTAEDYLRRLDGLGYEEVLALADPTGVKQRNQYRSMYRTAVENQRRARSGEWSPSPVSFSGVTGPDPGSPEARSGNY